jgi:FMN phosphatase YigB (HAD superfamily)
MDKSKVDQRSWEDARNRGGLSSHCSPRPQYEAYIYRPRCNTRLSSAFERVLIAETAKTTSMSERVHAIVSEWIGTRPLRYLRSCLFSGVPQLFAGLQRAGKRIGIFSDYPATAKLAAMGLAAHHVVAASDVGLLKPHARGLQSLMAAASAAARETLFIGDRADRDGVAGQRAGVRILIRSSKPIDAFQTFKTFHDPLFDPFMQ